MLCFDLGNSRVKWWDGIKSGACEYDQLNTAVETLAKTVGVPDDIVFATVVQDERLAHFKSALGFFPGASVHECVVTARAGDVVCGYEDIGRLGIDRWLAMIGGWTLLGESFVVVDLGTAATLDFVDTSGRHVGGYIIPGLRLGIKGLLAGTNRVTVEREQLIAASRLPGRNTVDAVSNGAMAAMAAVIEVSLRRHQASNPGANLLITGGDAPLVGALLECHYQYRNDLVFVGMTILHRDGLTKRLIP